MNNDLENLFCNKCRSYINIIKNNRTHKIIVNVEFGTIDDSAQLDLDTLLTDIQSLHLKRDRLCNIFDRNIGNYRIVRDLCGFKNN